MTITLYQTPDGWTLHVDGRAVIVGESFAVVIGVAERLQAGRLEGIGELDEVARGIAAAAGEGQ